MDAALLRSIFLCGPHSVGRSGRKFLVSTSRGTDPSPGRHRHADRETERQVRGERDRIRSRRDGSAKRRLVAISRPNTLRTSALDQRSRICTTGTRSDLFSHYPGTTTEKIPNKILAAYIKIIKLSLYRQNTLDSSEESLTQQTTDAGFHGHSLKYKKQKCFGELRQVIILMILH